jgi:anti-sigma factor RsiW
MNCAEASVLLHALIDNELDAGHAREVEAHVASCPDCAARLKEFRAMREGMSAARLKESAPASLRSRIELALPASSARTTATPSWSDWLAHSWRTFAGGFAAGTALAAAVAASLVIGIVHNDQDHLIANEVVSAHLRSLQPGHLTDVETSDQHTVKPWFNGKLDMAPPVIDLTAQGFALTGGRLDYVNREPVATIVYLRRKHVINLFVAEKMGTATRETKSEVIQGFNIRHWQEEGLNLWAVSDVNADELDEFCRKFTAALHSPSGPS